MVRYHALLHARYTTRAPRRAGYYTALRPRLTGAANYAWYLILSYLILSYTIR